MRRKLSHSDGQGRGGQDRKQEQVILLDREINMKPKDIMFEIFQYNSYAWQTFGHVKGHKCLNVDRKQGNKICISSRVSTASLLMLIIGVIRFILYKDITGNSLKNWYKGSRGEGWYNKQIIQ